MEKQVFNPELLKRAIFSNPFQISRMTLFFFFFLFSFFFFSPKGFCSVLEWMSKQFHFCICCVCDALGWGKCTEGKPPMALNKSAVLRHRLTSQIKISKFNTCTELLCAMRSSTDKPTNKVLSFLGARSHQPSSCRKGICIVERCCCFL